MIDFQTFHKYNRLVRRGLVKPLTCERCDAKLIVRMDDEDEVVLDCFDCPSTIKPGLKLYKEVQAVVQEHLPSPGNRQPFKGPV